MIMRSHRNLRPVVHRRCNESLVIRRVRPIRVGQCCCRREEGESGTGDGGLQLKEDDEGICD